MVFLLLLPICFICSVYLVFQLTSGCSFSSCLFGVLDTFCIRINFSFHIFGTCSVLIIFFLLIFLFFFHIFYHVFENFVHCTFICSFPFLPNSFQIHIPFSTYPTLSCSKKKTYQVHFVRSLCMYGLPLKCGLPTRGCILKEN